MRRPLAPQLIFHSPAAALVDEIVRRLAYLNNALFFGLLELSLADGFFSRFGDLPSCQLLLQLDISSKCGVFVQILVILRLEESSARLILRSDRWLLRRLVPTISISQVCENSDLLS